MMKKLVLATLVTISSFDIARAADPRCAKMRDKVGCNCALQNGGGISKTGGWYSKLRQSDPVNERFVQCMIRAGRR